MKHYVSTTFTIEILKSENEAEFNYIVEMERLANIVFLKSALKEIICGEKEIDTFNIETDSYNDKFYFEVWLSSIESHDSMTICTNLIRNGDAIVNDFLGYVRWEMKENQWYNKELE